MRYLKKQYKNEVVKMRELMTSEPIVCFDIETTGLNRQTDHILSFSAIKYIYEQEEFKEIDRINLFINPGIHIPEKISEINHIYDETVKDCPKENEAALLIREFLGDNPVVMGYNSISFDEGFVNAMYVREFNEPFVCKFHLDVYKMAKEKLNLSSYKLCNVAINFCNNDSLEFHNSLDDVIATFESFKGLLNLYTEDEIIALGSEVTVLSATHWYKSHALNRIYIQNSNNASIYYDIYKQEWVAAEDVNLESVRQQVFDMYNINTEEDLIKKIA